jgi:predicted kinase
MLTREFILEGVNDPNIFKAVFMAGGPGSGKSFVARQLGLQAAGLRTINSDDAFEYLLRKHQLDPKMPPEEQEKRDIIRQRAKDITSTKRSLAIQGRLGLIIDGTAKNPEKTASVKQGLEALGYDTMMIFVNTSLPVALERNRMRARSVPNEVVKKAHEEVQLGKEGLEKVFGSSFVQVLNDMEPDFKPAYKKLQSFLRKPLSPNAQEWVNMHTQRKK